MSTNSGSDLRCDWAHNLRPRNSLNDTSLQGVLIAESDSRELLEARQMFKEKKEVSANLGFDIYLHPCSDGVGEEPDHMYYRDVGECDEPAMT